MTTVRYNLGDMTGVERALDRGAGELATRANGLRRTDVNTCDFPPGLGSVVSAEAAAIGALLRSAADGWQVEGGWIRRALGLIHKAESGGVDIGNVVVLGAKGLKSTLEQIDKASQRIDKDLAHADALRRWLGYTGDVFDGVADNKLSKAFKLGPGYLNLRHNIQTIQTNGGRRPRLALNDLKRYYKDFGKRLDASKPAPTPGAHGAGRLGRAALAFGSPALDGYSLYQDVRELMDQKHGGIRGGVEIGRDSLAVTSSSLHLSANGLYATVWGAPAGVVVDGVAYVGDVGVGLVDVVDKIVGGD